MFKSQETKILTNQTQFNINKTEQKEFLCSYTQVAKINKNHYDCDSQFYCYGVRFIRIHHQDGKLITHFSRSNNITFYNDKYTKTKFDYKTSSILFVYCA